MKLTPDNKIIVEYNDYGIPVGEGGIELRSYIGVVVRDNVSILYDDWRRVPLETKEKLWDHVLVIYDFNLVQEEQKVCAVDNGNFVKEIQISLKH